MKYYTVYAHVNKINKKVYIGTTSQRLTKRWQAGGGYKKQPEFYQDIKKYGWNNYEHVILEENLTRDEAEEKEKYYIKKYDSSNSEHGYNKELGGIYSNKKIAEETRIKMKQAQMRRAEQHYKIHPKKEKKPWKPLRGKDHPMYGKHISQEQKDKRRKTMQEHFPNGYKHSAETKKKISEKVKGKVISEQQKEKISKIFSKKVIQYDMNMNYIQEWESVTKAEKELKIYHISNVCNGNRKHAGGYIWRFKSQM